MREGRPEWPEGRPEQNRRFAFGKNWASYAETMSEAKIGEAVASLRRLVDGEDLTGRRFLDIGCGSGVHSLAALRLGAAEVVAVDIDADSVSTTEAMLERHAPGARYRVARESVFALDPTVWGMFDVVYSWGVLHHTGDLFTALRRAAALVAREGTLVVALYRKTWLCGFWRWEKRWYARASPRLQSIVRGVYLGLFALELRLTGQRLDEYVARYVSYRGMDFYHDVHDWLGGYPYESVSPREVEAVVAESGLAVVRSYLARGRYFGRYTGILGSGCDEYICTRPRLSPPGGG